MRLDWTEPWTKRLIRRRMAEMRGVVRSILPVTLWGMVGILVVVAVLYIAWPELAEEVPWQNVLRRTLVIPALLLGQPFLLCVFPQSVHLVEKGISFQMGSSCSFFRYDQIVSISFSDALGFHQFVVKVRNKKGNIVERTADASPKVSDQDIVKFLADIGYSHLVKFEFSPNMLP